MSKNINRTARRGAGIVLQFAGTLLFANSVFAEPQQLAGPALRAAVAGATVEIDTPIGTKVPVKYGADNSVAGEAGSVAFFLGSAADTGRWWVQNDQLCHRWNIWFKAEKTCLRIARDGNKITWQRDDGDTGTATIMPSATVVAARQISNRKSTLGGPVPPPEEVGPVPVVAETAKPVAPPVAARVINEAPIVPAAETPVEAEVAPPEAVAAPEKPAARRFAKADISPALDTAASVPPAKPQVKKQLVKRAPPKAATGLGMDRGMHAATFWVHGVAPNDVLNVRMGPSPEFDVVGAIPPAARGVRMTGACEGMWCLVDYGGKRGWVNRAYLMYEIPELVAAR